MSISELPTRCRNTAWRTMSATSSVPMTGLGMRANCRELVDHALDVVDLAHDGVGALVEDGRVFLDHRAIFPAQPLGRQLDRSERILDLVRDTAGNVGPGRGALRAHQFGDVVERDHVAFIRSPDCSLVTRTDKLRSRPARLMVDLTLHQALHARAGGRDQFDQFGRDFGERPV